MPPSYLKIIPLKRLAVALPSLNKSSVDAPCYPITTIRETKSTPELDQ